MYVVLKLTIGSCFHLCPEMHTMANLAIFSIHTSSYDARRKYGEHERRVPRGAAQA